MSSPYKELLKDLKYRLAVGLFCFLVGGVLSLYLGGGFIGFVVLLPFIGVAAVILAPGLAEFCAQPFASILYNSEKLDHTLPMYSIPQSRRAKGLYEEAMVEYEKIAAEYPDEAKPYIEMVTMAIVDLRDVARAKSILARGLTVLKEEGAQKVLREVYEVNLTRLELKPEWLQEQEGRTIVPAKIDGSKPVDEPDGLTHRRFHPGGYVQAGKDGFVDDRKKIARIKGLDKGGAMS